MTRKKLMLFASITLLVSGIAVIGYPFFQNHLDQRRLEKEFDEYTAAPVASPEDDSERFQRAPEDAPIWPEQEFPQWEALPPTKLIIPKLNLEVQVDAVEDMGVFARKLSQTPSYYPQSAFPGQDDNVLIAGHRDGPAGYFLKLSELEPGDIIILSAPGVSYTYEVEKVWIVQPTEVSVIDPLGYAALTLTTCERVGSDPAARRLIVRALYIGVEITD